MGNGWKLVAVVCVVCASVGVLGCTPPAAPSPTTTTTSTSTTTTTTSSTTSTTSTTTTLPPPPVRHFPTSSTFNGGSTPTDVHLADLDEDGAPDLVLVTGGSSQQVVSVALNDGAGGFGPRSGYSAGSTITSISVADVNGDGHQDVIAANGTAGTIQVLLGSGSGTLAAPIPTTTGGRPTNLAVGDVNHDGHLDLAVSDFSESYRAFVLLGAGDGSFTVSSVTEPAKTTQGVALGDLDGDGSLDLITTSDNGPGGGGLSVQLGNGDGSFGPRSDTVLANRGGTLKTADMNGDGVLDVVTAPRDVNEVDIFLGDGLGQLGPAQVISRPVALTSIDPEIADMNGDGAPDIVVGDNSNKQLAVVLAVGGGSFATSAVYANGAVARFIDVGDIDGDGRLDVVSSAGVYSSTVTVTRGRGGGRLEALQLFSTGRPMVVTDLDGDGRQDLVSLAAGNAYTVFVNLGQPGGTLAYEGPKFKTPTVYVFPGLVQGLAVGDVNGDGHPDVLTANTTSGTVSVLLGVGDGTFTGPTDFPAGSGPIGIELADLDGDGHLDVAVANSGAGGVGILLGNGDGSFQSPTAIATGTSPYGLTVTDLDGDGNQDVVVTNGDSTTNTMSILLGHGDGTFAPKTDIPTGTSPREVTHSDVDGDGHEDLVVANSGSSTVSVYLGDGHGNFGTPLDIAANAGIARASAGDADGDGVVDLVFNSPAGVLALYHGHGDGTFDGPQPLLATSTSGTVVADVDGDGYNDIVLGSGAGNGVLISEA